MKAYEFIEEKEIKELETMARVYEHKKTGAKVLCLENKDDNKVFSIAFRTPAEDSTGVAHITEHSVLCGSKKFPLKDPFVELVKGSLKTFLNAMTYPDKTVYPVASQNDKDFQNLMDVYLDAVFHPNCLENYRTFLQEGWHYTLNKEGKLCYSGVVYNEMRGAFSDPESVLERYTFHSLFPDTSYGNESGGDPEDIPKLTYDAFKAFHQRFYHPSNSFIILYGDMNMEEKLNWIDEAYLQDFERISPNSEIARQQPFGKMVEESQYYPISEKDSSENKAYLSYNFVLDAGQDAKKSMAFSYLDHALLSGPGAVLKQKLLEAGLGEDVFGGYSDGILQHYFSVISKNVSEERAGEFLQLIQDCFLDAAENGLDHKTILAAIHHDAFQYKEADYGSTPKGLVYSLNALDSWLYGGKPWLYLEAEAIYKELMEEVDKGYFEKLLKENFLNNPHSSLLRLLPKKGMTEQKEEKLSEELQARWQAFSPEEKEQIKKVKEELTLYQQTENTEEALKTLPVLSRKDIKREAESYPYQEGRLGDRKLILVPGDSKGVLYLRLQFHTDGLSEEELSYLSFLRTCLAYMDTENYRFQDFNSEIYLHTGGFSVDLTAYPDFVEKDRYTGVLALDFKLLQGELKNAVEYLEEMLFRTVYQEEKRLSEILLEAKSRERMRLEGSGHSYAVTRAMSGFSPSSHFQEQIKGIVYLHFLEQLEEDFRKNPKALGEKLTALSRKIFSGERLFLAAGGDIGIFEKEKKELTDFLGRRFPEKEDWRETKFVGGKERREAFSTTSQVNYVATAGSFQGEAYPYTGSLKVLKVILSYDFLWKNIREQGNAYGAMCGFGRNGESFMVSYRDPHVQRTLEQYRKVAEYLENFKATELELNKYVIGAISELDMPKSAYTKFLLGLSCYLSKLTKEDLQREREELLDVEEKDIRNLSAYIKRAFQEKALCAIGNKGEIEKAKAAFESLEEI